MPIYEYKCSSCEHLEEVLQKFSDPPPDPCPKCGAKGTMHKEVSMTSFQLKGGGWYNDLYSSVPKGDADKAGSKNEKDSSSGGETKKAETPNKEKSPEKKKSSSTTTKNSTS